ncbi:GmrSD restriction endonuclease domain-containing protein [Cellulosimicrobium cellulans]|uniref:GmrSD restriction endonuclease domain-containing protein n=1 Tax=Cellulosimicrobium cellulans TaxID=1710 RepID=UPI00344F0077
MVALIVALVVAVGAAGCATEPLAGQDPGGAAGTQHDTAGSPQPAAPQPEVAEEAGPGSALAALTTLEVKGRAPRTGYDRDQFGPAWADVDRNGCDTRNDILARDLTGETFEPGTHDCVVLTGTLADPYTGTTIAFQRGNTTSSAVQIDHVVALSDAWQKGAQQLDAATRQQLSNDPLNLLAADGPTNQAKGDGDAATWLPPNTSFRCAYVARQVAVKAAYGLWVTQAEHDAIARVLSSCPDEPLPGAADAAAPRAEEPSPAAPAPTSAPPPAPAPAPAPADVVYENCAAVRAAGAAPIHAGQPGYSPEFDGDGDGVGCE